MLIDTLSERYGLLPSEVMLRATTFDVFVADTAIGYRNYQQERAYGNTTKEYNPHDYSQEDLKNILEGRK